MFKKVILSLVLLILGIFAGYLVSLGVSGKSSVPVISKPKPKVIGFLPFWLIPKASLDYSKYVTDLTYFALTVDGDGTIQKYTKRTEGEPGYFSLKNGKADPFFSSARENGVSLSLSVFSGDDDKITSLLNDPQKSAQNLVSDVGPIIKDYGFSTLNLDIEQVSDASPEARIKFTQFVRKVRDLIDEWNLGGLSIDVSASAFVKDTNLVDPKSIAQFVDSVVVMAYDYHYMGSMVTGPVAPGTGAGSISEFDTETAIYEALKIMPPEKIILGMPLYGYGWETLGDTPRSPTIPSSGMVVSSKYISDFLPSCINCMVSYDDVDKEMHAIYRDEKTGTIHQIFYPTEKSTSYKVNFAKDNNLGGVALWALGYEDASILLPLSGYRR